MSSSDLTNVRAASGIFRRVGQVPDDPNQRIAVVAAEVDRDIGQLLG